MHTFLVKDKYRLLFLGTLLIAVFFLSYSPSGHFVGTPKFWRDEAIPFDIARTFVDTGKLDVGVAPGVAFDVPYMTHATGFTVTVPMAGFFYIFGVGVFQSRMYMALWILATLGAAFFVGKQFFGSRAAFFTSLLLATFGPLYANGKTSTGEIPGFFFLLFALYFLYKKEKPSVAGIFFALALVSKPSLYIPMALALIVEMVIVERARVVRSGMRVALGAAPVIVFWLWLIVPHPFALESWQGMAHFYQYAINDDSLWSQLPGALFGLLTHTTVLYTLGLLCIIGYGFFRISWDREQKRLISFILAYSLLSIAYFLRSPGWLRYLLGVQMLYLFVAYPVIESIISRMRLPLKTQITATLCVGIMLGAHVMNFFFLSDIRSSTKSIETAAYINSELARMPSSTVGIAYDPMVASQISSQRKFQIGTIGGRDTYYGVHPLSVQEDMLPTFFFQGAFKDDRYDDVLRQYYKPYGSIAGLYKKQ